MSFTQNRRVSCWSDNMSTMLSPEHTDTVMTREQFSNFISIFDLCLSWWSRAPVLSFLCLITPPDLSDVYCDKWFSVNTVLYTWITAMLWILFYFIKCQFIFRPVKHTEDKILYMTGLLACVVNFDRVANNALDDCPANQVCIHLSSNKTFC